MQALRRHEDIIQILTGVIVGALVGWRLHVHGWPWIAWLPAALLACFGVGLVWVIIWFVARKLTYEKLATRNRADLQAGGDGWPNHRQ